MFTPIANASVAQLVEHHLAKVNVVSSNLIARSILDKQNPLIFKGFFLCMTVNRTFFI